MSSSPGDSLERLAVIGDPVEHSLSPAMQGAALAAAGLPWIYEAVHVKRGELWLAVLRLRDSARGFNVTIPHKHGVIQYIDELCACAESVTAVNTVVRMDGRLIGHNTDIAGFTAALLSQSPDLRRRAVVFGAGGAASAVVWALGDLGVRVSIVNRTFLRADNIARRVQGAEVLRPDAPQVLEQLAEAGVVINSTSLGLQAGDPSPLPDDAELRSDAVVMDLVYGRDTAFLRQARQLGCRVSDGVEMLVRQGAESFRLWTGLDPDLEVMRAACRQELEVRAC